MPHLGDEPAHRPPGGVYQYSNAGYVLLGLVIEEVTGQRFVDVVRRRVFDPAGMSASGFFRFDEAVPDVALGYLPRATPDAPWRSNIYRVPVLGGADGGAQCTAGDLDRFLRAYADGTLLGDLGPAVLTRHADAGQGFGYGYGVLLYADGRIGHGGGDPGVEALVHRWPAEDVHLVVLCNVEDQAGDVRDRMVTAARTVGVLERAPR